MARTTITNDRVVPQDTRVAQTVNFDMSMTGYGDDTPVKAPIAKPNPKLTNKNGDMPVVSARANNAIIRDVSAKPVVASAPKDTSSGLGTIGYTSSVREAVSGQPDKPAPMAVAKPKTQRDQPYASIDKGVAESDSVVGDKRSHVSSTGTAIKVGIKMSNGADISYTNFNRDNQVDTNGVKSATHFTDDIVNITAPLGDAKDGLIGKLNFRKRSKQDIGKPTSSESVRIRPSIAKKMGDADRGGALTVGVDFGSIFGVNSNNGVATSTFTQQVTLGAEYNVSLLPKSSPTKLNLVTTSEVRGQMSSTGANGIGLAQSVDLKMKAPLFGGNLIARAGIIIEKGGQPDALWGTELSPLGGISVEKVLTAGYEIRF
jgi:hypothetical protein